MKTMQKLLLLAGTLALLMLPVQAEEAAAETIPDVTGETLAAAYQTWYNVEWKFESSTGTLYIGGEGALPQGGPSFYPWYSYASQIQKVVVEEGITDLAYSSVRADTISYTEIHLPSTLTEMDGVLLHGYTLKTITAAEGGMFYVRDGILFKDDGTDVTLVCQPGGLVLYTYTIPEDVTKIGDYAFMSQTLRELTLPEGLVSIGSQAFYGCNALTSLYIPAAVTDIDAAAFTYCNVLESITVDADNPVYTAQDGVLFSKDGKLLHTYPAKKAGSAYTVPDGVEQIASTVMTHSRILEELTLSATVKEIVQVLGSLSPLQFRAVYVDADNPYLSSEDGILYNKDKTTLLHYPIGHTATEYVMPDTVTTVVNNAVWAVSNLTTVYWGSGLETIESRIYWGGGLKNMYFPGDVPAWMTNGCRNVRSQATMYYPEGNTTWTDGSMTIDGNTYTTAAYEAEEDTIQWNTWENIRWKFDKTTGTLTVAGEGEIPSVGWKEFPWFENMADITALVIEEGITVVPQMIAPAAYGYALTSVSLPSTVTYVDPWSFRYAESLQGFTVAEGGEYYAEDGVLFRAEETKVVLTVYPAGTGETSYTIPEGVTYIAAQSVCADCLQELILPESLLGIDMNAISARYITTIHIPKKVENIDITSLALLDSLMSITVDAGNQYFTSVDGVLYTKDMKLLHTYPPMKKDTSYRIADGVVSVSRNIFWQSQYLESLHFPASVSELVDSNWYRSSGVLKTITVDSANQTFTAVDNVIFSKDMTKLIHYPFAKEDVYYCIPEGVTTIAAKAMLALPHMDALFMGKDVQTVEQAFFQGCGFEKVYFPGDVPAYLNQAFSNLRETVILYFPRGNQTWTEGTMTVDGVTYTTSSFRLKADITGDGTTDRNDLSLLQQYFSGYPTEIDESAVDLDGNGKLTRKDGMILARYLAGWDGYDVYFD